MKSCVMVGLGILASICLGSTPRALIAQQMNGVSMKQRVDEASRDPSLRALRDHIVTLSRAQSCDGYSSRVSLICVVVFPSADFVVSDNVFPSTLN